MLEESFSLMHVGVLNIHLEIIMNLQMILKIVVSRRMFDLMLKAILVDLFEYHKWYSVKFNDLIKLFYSNLSLTSGLVISICTN